MGCTPKKVVSGTVVIYVAFSQEVSGAVLLSSTFYTDPMNKKEIQSMSIS